MTARASSWLSLLSLSHTAVLLQQLLLMLGPDSDVPVHTGHSAQRKSTTPHVTGDKCHPTSISAAGNLLYRSFSLFQPPRVLPCCRQHPASESSLETVLLHICRATPILFISGMSPMGSGFESSLSSWWCYFGRLWKVSGSGRSRSYT